MTQSAIRPVPAQEKYDFDPRFSGPAPVRLVQSLGRPMRPGIMAAGCISHPRQLLKSLISGANHLSMRQVFIRT
jgi:hypothetical protein